MVYSVSSSPSSSLYRQPPCTCLSKSRNLNYNNPFVKLSPFSFSLQINTNTSTHVSLQEPTTNTQHPDAQKPPKSYVWINPKSRKAPKLWRKSHSARYASFVKVAEALDSCNEEDQVFEVLNGLSEKVRLLEQDAVAVINNMSSTESALFALRFFQERLQFNKEVVVYNVTLKVFRKRRDLGGAEKLFGEMLERGVRPDNVTFSTVISCARLSNLPHKAVEWFEKMPGFGISPDDVTFSAMIDAYGRAGNVEMALSLYDRARSEKWRLDVVTFSTLIKVYGMSGNYDGCLNVYGEMKVLGVKPNMVTYNTLLDAMGRAKRPWQAKAIYKEMISNGLSPNSITYSALLHAYGRARYGEDALEVYREMKEKGAELNVILYNTLLAMFSDLGHVDQAVEIYEDMKKSMVMPDSWTFSSLITIFSCSGKVSEAEKILNEMLEAGFELNIFVLTSLVQCYGKAQLMDDVVRTFDRFLKLGITPDDRFCGCLRNVMTQSPKEELGKIIGCIERANSKLGHVVKLLVDGQENEGDFKREAAKLFTSISADAKKAYCNCLIDFCINLNMLERACELLDLGMELEIYVDLQSRSSTQWSLYMKGLSLGAALTALHVWINDLSKTLESGEALPPLLGINTGNGKHKYSDKSLAGVFESHLKELNAPFHEAPDQVGWFLTTKVAVESWLESRKSTEGVA